MDALLAPLLAWFQKLNGVEMAFAGAAVATVLGMVIKWLKKPALPTLSKLPNAPGAAQGLCAWLVRLWLRFVAIFDYLSTRREWRYQQPWVLMLGEQGAGKSSLLQSVAVSMRQTPPARAAELQAVHTDWYFFRKGVLIDPQGKYAMAQPGSSEEQGWRQTMRELNELRPERPLDGLVLCISARTLLSANSDAREALAIRLNRQLSELQEDIDFTLPLTVILTQCDCIKGYAAFWHNQNKDRRLELFGYAAPPQAQSWAPSEWTNAAFDTLNERLRALQVETAARSDSIADSDAFFLFPSHFEHLRLPLRSLLEAVLRSSAWQAGYLFRGLFFTGSPDANGDLREGARKDVAFADSLLAMRVLAEAGLARPTRKGIFSRNALIRSLQYASISFAVLMFVALYFAGVHVAKQVDVLVSAMAQLKYSTPDAVRHGDCLGAESIYPLLTGVAAINQNTHYWAIPVSWVDTRITHRNDAGIETDAINNVLMPTLACRLENQARDIAAASYKLPDEKDGEAYSKSSQALTDKLKAVRELEDNLARFSQLAEHGGDLSRGEIMSTLAALSQYAFDVPLPDEVMHEHGALSSGFGNVAVALKPILPPRLHEDLAAEINRIARATRASLRQEVARGATLLGLLERAEPPVLDNTRRFAAWLSWTEKSWLMSTPAVNPCAELHTSTKAQIDVLVSQYSYPKSLWREVEQFNTERCYQPEMKNLAELRQAPYGALFTPRAAGGMEMAAGIRRDLAGLPTLVQLNFMRLTNPRHFNCLPAAEGFRQTEVTEAAGYVREYENFVTQMKLPPLASGKRPLYDRLARLSLGHALDDAMQRSQIATTETPAQQVSLETVLQADQQLAGMSKELSGGLDNLLAVLRNYGDYGDATSTPLVRQCVRNFAADTLGRVSALTASSRLYAPTPTPSGDLIFDLGSLPVQKEYLARQVARAQVLAGYATPFMNLLEGVPGVSDTQRNPPSTADFWRNSINELNRYTQGKEPTGQVGNLDNYFISQLGGLTYSNCSQQLAKYQSPDFGNDLFSTRRRTLEPMVQLRCLDRRVAQAMETYNTLAQRFNADLAGRYPFADSNAADARVAVVRQFFVDYAQQRPALGEALKVLNGEAAKDARQFVADLDAVAEFFRSNLLAGDEGAPIQLQLTFNAPAQTAAGSEQIVAWLFSSGKQAVGQPNRGSTLNWKPGDSVALDLSWADRSVWTPQAEEKQSDLRVSGNTASFSAGNAWALLRMINLHAVGNNSSGSQILLGFDVPQQRELAAGKAERSRVNLYLGMTLLGSDGKGDTRLRLPARFPTSAPLDH